MAILEGGHIVPPPHSSYIQKPLTIRVNPIPVYHFGTPYRFPFIDSMVFTLNQRILAEYG